ncbi:O-antigen ligase family protein [Microbacterium halimionae]|uniref:O-antigen ligase family protein n=1 Tax=Microbacterium halimionae TaxID=1526413 RepID=UPI001420E957|nr:O-antigen ligase family protein [Microbacterium halimionae]NII94911.1 O-antigen ligase [Microbacterium halimionae]
MAFYPVLWLTGLGGIYMVLMAVPSSLYLVRSRVSRPGVLALLVGATIGISIPVGIAAFGFDGARLIGAVANMCVWLVLAAALTAAAHVDFRGRLLKALSLAVIAQALLILASAAIYPRKLPVPLLDSVAARLPSGIGAFADNALYVSSWLGGAAFRTSGIWANPTWAAATASLVILVTIFSEGIRPRKTLAALALFAGGVAVYFGLSRTSYSLLAAGLVVGLLMKLRRRSQLLFLGAIAIAIPVFVAILLAGQGAISSFFEEVDGARSGSSKSRGEVYATTWDYILRNPFPLLGYGLKPQVEGLVASVGTLSTYLGLAFRAGLLGLLLFAALLFLLARRCFHQGSASGMVVVVFIAIWAVIADMDAGHLVPLFLVFCVHPEPPNLRFGRARLRSRGSPLAARRKHETRKDLPVSDSEAL